MGDWSGDWNPYQAPMYQPPPMTTRNPVPPARPSPAAPQGSWNAPPAPTRYGGGGDSAGDPLYGAVYQPVYTPPPVPPGGSPNVDILRQPTQYAPPSSPGERETQFQDPMQQAQQDAVRRQVYQNVKIAPGVAPNIGVLPDRTPIDLTSFNPYTGPTNVHAPRFTGFDPQTQLLLDLAARSPKMPKFSDLSPGPVPNNTGFGYKLGGQVTPQEDELFRRAQRGDLRAATQLADMRSRRFQSAEPQGRIPQWITNSARIADLAFIGAGLGVATGGVAGALGAAPIIAGGIGGAAGSAGSQAIGNHGHVNPWQVGLGALGGAAVPGLTSMGVNPVLAGAGVGAATGAASGPAQGRPFNPMDIAAGAAGGAAGGGAQQAGVPSFATPVISNLTSQGVNVATGNRPPAPRPVRRRQRMQGRLVQRNPYRR